MSNDVAPRPIQTLYNGYRFRSRLEARWAVFFDRNDKRYVYESEGYQLPSGPYLPDFFFPDAFPGGDAFLEVKPASSLPTSHFEFSARTRATSIGGLRRRPIRSDGMPREIVQACEMTAALKLAPGAFVVVYGDPVDVLCYGDGGSVCIDEHGLTTGIGFLDWFPNLCTAADEAPRRPLRARRARQPRAPPATPCLDANVAAPRLARAPLPDWAKP